MGVNFPLYQTIAKGYFSDEITFGKGGNAFKMDSKDTYRWYDRLYAIFFGVQWTQISVRDSNKHSKRIYVRTLQLATFLKMGVQQITEKTSLELTQKFYEVKKLKGKISAIINTKHTLQHIMSFLNLQSLGRCRRVSEAWKRAIDDEPQLWQSIIYRQLAFGNDKWAQCFGPDVIKDEPDGEDFASLPWREVIADFKNINKIFPKRKVTDCLMLVRLPKTLNGGLSINSLGLLAAKYFPPDANGHGYGGQSWLGIVRRQGNKSINESYWVLMTKDILPGSFQKHPWISYSMQQQMVADLAKQSLNEYRVPNILEATACILSQYFDSRIRLFESTYSRCLENTDGEDAAQLTVGKFTPSGLILRNDSWVDAAGIGIAALRKFS